MEPCNSIRVPATITWSRPVGKGVSGSEQLMIEADLNDPERKQLGLDMGGFVRGRARIRLAGENMRGRLGKAHVEANLRRSELRIDAIRWRRAPGSKAAHLSTSTLPIPSTRSSTISRSRAPSLSVTGRLILGTKGEKSAPTFPRSCSTMKTASRSRSRRKENAHRSQRSMAGFRRKKPDQWPVLEAANSG